MPDQCFFHFANLSDEDPLTMTVIIQPEPECVIGRFILETSDVWEVGDARFIKIINLLLLLNLKVHIYEMLFKYKNFFFFLQNAKSLLFYPFPFSFLPSFSSVSLSLFPCNLTVFLLQHVQKHIPNLMSNMLAILVARISCHSLN